MADRALDIYLNDHLGGATLGSDLAEQIGERSKGTPLGDLMAEISPEIDEERQTLIDLMEKLGVSQNPLKQASAWLAEKASRIKFGGASSGEPDFGLYMAVETLTLGVEGKLSLWKALKQMPADHPVHEAVNLDDLIAQAQSQHDRLEAHRIELGPDVLSGSVSGAAKLA